MRTRYAAEGWKQPQRIADSDWCGELTAGRIGASARYGHLHIFVGEEKPVTAASLQHILPRFTERHPHRPQVIGGKWRRRPAPCRRRATPLVFPRLELWGIEGDVSG